MLITAGRRSDRWRGRAGRTCTNTTTAGGVIDNKFSGAGGLPCYKPEAGFGGFATGGIMAEDRIFAAGFIALGIILSAVAVWVILSI